MTLSSLARALPLLVAGVATLATVEAQAQRTLRLTVGQSHTIQVPCTITKVQVLNPSVADVANYSTKGATVVGINAGSTEVHVHCGRRRRRFNITVTAVETSSLLKQVRAFLGRIEGIYPRLFGDQIVLSGHALTADDYGRAQQAVRIFGNKIQNHVRFKPSAVQQVNQIFRRSGLGNVQANLIGGTLFLEGAVASRSEMSKVQALLKTFGLNAENLLTVGGGRQVLVDVQFVEMRKSGLNRIGVKWPDAYTVTAQGTLTGTIPIAPSGQNEISLQILSPVQAGNASLNLLFSSGYARLLAQPKLVCGSGKAAEFLVGGEVPIVMVTQSAVSIDWKSYGIKLKIKPVADSLGNIQSEIYAEVSEPDRSVAVQNIPGFRVRKFKTDVSVKDGASIVLSGLFSNTEEKSVAKMPLLGHIPIIGELFKSREFQERKTTLVVFVTPKVVTSEHPWVRSTIRDIQKMYKDYEAEVGWQVFD
jgi:pilus assembly protein CpaC